MSFEEPNDPRSSEIGNNQIQLTELVTYEERAHGVTLVLLCFIELIVAWVVYVCVGRSYQNRGETLLG